jgi:hypothetical protein
LTSRQTTNGTAYNFSYQYNLAGGLAQETYPTGRQVTSCYDEAGRVSQVKQKATPTSAEKTVANVTQYWEHGPAQQMSIGDGLVSENTVYDDARLQLRKITAGTVAAGNWEQKLQYCATGSESTQCTTNNGNILKQIGYCGAEWTYQYDRVNRLSQVVETVGGAQTWQQRFNYDQAGNRWLLNESGTLIPNLEATPRAAVMADPSPFDAKNQWNGAQYDAGGNQKTSWGDGSGVGASKYDYDGENKLKRAEVRWTSSTTGVTEYGYDGEGRRVLRREGGAVKTVFVYDAMGHMVAEYGDGAAMPCSTCYLTADHLGSTRVVWGTDGVMKKLYDYAPLWGGSGGELSEWGWALSRAAVPAGGWAGGDDGVYREGTRRRDWVGLFRGQVHVQRSGEVYFARPAQSDYDCSSRDSCRSAFRGRPKPDERVP